MRNLGRDFRYGWRRLRATPAFTVFAIVTLALGIGVTTGIYSAVRAVMSPPDGRGLARDARDHQPLAAPAPPAAARWCRCRGRSFRNSRRSKRVLEPRGLAIFPGDADRQRRLGSVVQ